VEEEIKEWLKKKLEMNSKKEDINKTSNKILQNSQVSQGRQSSEVHANVPETIIKRGKEITEPVIKAPIQEKSSPIFSSTKPTKEIQPNVISTKSNVPVIIGKEGISPISPIKEIQAVERDSETGKPRKPRTNNKILIGIALTLGIIVIIISFFVFIVPNIPSENHEYKIFITHNGNPIGLDSQSKSSGLAYSYGYGMDVYNNTSYCGNEFIESAITNSPSYTFDSKSVIDGKSIRDYEKDGYAFDLYASVMPFQSGTTNSLEVGATIRSKDVFDSILNYQELPKLSKNYQITFDMPIVVNSSVSTNLSRNEINAHVELFDNWNENVSFVCQLIRDYNDTIDNNLKGCGTQLAFLITRNQQCARKYFSECGSKNTVTYVTDAKVQGRSIDCSLPLNNLIHGENYEVIINMYKKLNSALYLSYIISLKL
jgi:hypothetical protein